MSKRKDTKVWIKIKRGIATDPKHRQRLGNAIWLYLMLIDEADWETGIVDPYKDEDMAGEMATSISWIREQRRLLEKEGYIECQQLGQKGQRITITKWINPKSYGGEVRNQPKQSGEKVSPSDKGQSVTQSDTQSGAQSVAPSVAPSVTPAHTPTLYPGTNDQESPAAILWREEMKSLISPFDLETFSFLFEAYSRDRLIEAMQTAVKRGSPNASYIRGILMRGDIKAGATDEGANGNDNKPAEHKSSQPVFFHAPPSKPKVDPARAREILLSAKQKPGEA